MGVRRKLGAAAAGLIILAGGSWTLFAMRSSSNPVDASQVIAAVVAVGSAVAGACVAVWRWGYRARRERSHEEDGDSRGAKEPVGRPKQIWRIPARNPDFTGRARDLLRLSVAPHHRGRLAGNALHGIGGIGKTALATEYAHQFSDDFDIAWWVDAEQEASVGEQIRQLAVALEIVDTKAPVMQAVETCLRWLRQHGNWLLIFDNAEDPQFLISYIPDGPGQVLVTTRDIRWGQLCEIVELDVLARKESVGLLSRSVPRITAGQAGLIAEALGDLPLAVAQAGAFMAESRLDPGKYLELLQRETSYVLGEGVPVRYGKSLVLTTRVALAKVDAEMPPISSPCDRSHSPGLSAGQGLQDRPPRS